MYPMSISEPIPEPISKSISESIPESILESILESIPESAKPNPEGYQDRPPGGPGSGKCEHCNGQMYHVQ